MHYISDSSNGNGNALQFWASNDHFSMCNVITSTLLFATFLDANEGFRKLKLEIFLTLIKPHLFKYLGPSEIKKKQ